MNASFDPEWVPALDVEGAVTDDGTPSDPNPYLDDLACRLASDPGPVRELLDQAFAWIAADLAAGRRVSLPLGDFEARPLNPSLGWARQKYVAYRASETLLEVL